MNNIRTLRENLNISQEELGRRVGVKAPAVHKWEHDRNLPRMDIAIRMTQVLGCTLDQLMGLVPLDRGHDPGRDLP